MKGVRYLGIALPMAFIGPSIIYFGFGNRENPMFLVLLGVGFIIAVTCVLLMFRGILTIMKGLYDE